MLNRSIPREERSVLLEVLEKHQRVDVVGFKKKPPLNWVECRNCVWWGLGKRRKPRSSEKRVSQTDGASCKAWECESI